MAMALGGTALAAPSPTVTKLEFKDTQGTADLLDDKVVKMDTGFKAYRVALDARGNVYVTDPEVNTLYKFNSNGHLVATYKINAPLGIAVDPDGSIIYVGGYLNGQFAIFVLDQTGAVKGVVGKGSVGEPIDMAVDSSGNIITIGRDGAVIRVLNREGVLLKTFGPYLERHDVDPELPYARTRHSFISIGGVAIDDTYNEIYVTIKEYVDYLNNIACSGDRGNCSMDPDSHIYYSNTDQTYKYWYPAGARYVIFVVDKGSGAIKRRIPVNTYSETGSVSIIPWGLTLDGSRRLYLATSYQGVRVFDATAGGLLTVNGGFDGGSYFDLEYDRATGRVFATTGNRVVVYGIDGAVNPANTPPTTPTLVDPKDAYAAATPLFKVSKASDGERDPLAYGYEIKDSSGAVVNAASGFFEGPNGETLMQVSATLVENARYRWRAQAFDGNAATWSGEATFCVNERNDNPSTPTIIGPNGEKVSPFSSSLAWNPSTDPDCYDTLSYTVEVSNVSGFSTTVGGIGSASFSLAGIKGLANGGTYSWRVKAVDNNGGESAYSEGSFVYKTTSVRFESDLPNAKVYIDGNYGYFGRLLGTAPLEVQNITPGSHSITFVKAGYEPYHTIVDVTDPLSETGGLATVAATMVKASKIRPSNSGVELVKINAGNATPFVVDYNNDGFKDVIAGGKVNVYNDNGEIVDVIDGKVYLFLAQEQTQEDGTKKVVLIDRGALQANGADINVGSRAVPFVVDYNNDGKKDLLVGAGDGLTYLYLNIGSETDPAFAAAGTLKGRDGIDISVTSNASPAVVDYNNDGLKDLVLGSGAGDLRLYINGGTDAEPAYVTYAVINADNADLNAGSNSMPFFTDWNADGKKDLVVGRGYADSEGNTVNLLLNVGTDDAPSFVTISGLQKWIMEKKRVRGNREFIPYLGYNQDLGDLTGGSGNASPFVVDWNGSSARDVLVGNAGGGVVNYAAE
jgi:hypothetical protein